MAVERKKSDIDWLHTLRREEFKAVESFLPVSKEAKILEIGSGTGYLLNLLGQRFDSVNGLEVGTSAYHSSDSRISIYDGEKMPFDDASFDVIFSCHVIEHVEDFAGFCEETRRVLKPNGAMLHIAPSSTWRLFTTIFHYLHLASLPFRIFLTKDKSISQRSSSNYPTFKEKIFYVFMAPRHGLTGNRLTEIYYFSQMYWIKRFKDNQLPNVSVHSTKILYWGHDVIKFLMPLKFRKTLSLLFGSSSNIFVIKPK